jgi:integrase
LAIKNENNLKTKVLFESTKNIARHCDRQQVLQNAIISVYTLLPPRRLEYADAILYSKNAYDSMIKKNDTQNLDNSVYCIVGLKKGFFHYGKNTTKSKTSKNVVVDMPNELLNIFKKYIKTFDLRVGSYLFQTLRGQKFSKNLFGKELKKLDVSVNILRKSYLTNKYGAGVEEQLLDALMMNHSKGVQQSVYVKV